MKKLEKYIHCRFNHLTRCAGKGANMDHQQEIDAARTGDYAECECGVLQAIIMHSAGLNCPRCGKTMKKNYEYNRRISALEAQNADLLAALKMLASWRMRDGTPCFCPAGKDEDEPKGKMPTLHATSCLAVRAAIEKAEGN